MDAHGGRAGVALASGQGRAFWWTSDMLRVEKVVSEETAGRFAVSEITVQPGYASPPHVHSREDEAIYVLEGELTVFLESELIAAGPGSWFFFPRGVAHSFIIGERGPARLLVTVCPGGFERFYAEHGEPVVEGVQPGPPSLTRDEVVEIMGAEYGITLVPPPPGYPVTDV